MNGSPLIIDEKNSYLVNISYLTLQLIRTQWTHMDPMKMLLFCMEQCFPYKWKNIDLHWSAIRNIFFQQNKVLIWVFWAQKILAPDGFRKKIQMIVNQCQSTIFLLVCMKKCRLDSLLFFSTLFIFRSFAALLF